ncbi:MAG: hypothetical protein WC216_05455 [Gallionella sp.]|jgi:hypothetical protein
MISIEQYFMGRDQLYSNECGTDICQNAEKTVNAINKLLELSARDGIQPGIDPVSRNFVSSGWRPAALNVATCNAAAHSKHIDALACDLRDTSDRALARWCLVNLDTLAQLGLWMENPQWTPSWVHLQIIPPGSGNRVYIPSSAPPRCDPLPEQST